MKTRTALLEQLEKRELLAIDSLPTYPLLTPNDPIDIQVAVIDTEPGMDLAVLDRDGRLTVASNGGDDRWAAVTTTSLGSGTSHGFSLAPFDGDVFLDLAVQGSDAIHLFHGDGAGGFSAIQTIGADSPDLFAPSDGGRVRMASGLINQDFAVDLVTVSPGSDEFLVFLGNGDGTMAAPLRYDSGGSEPIAVVLGDFVGTGFPDVAVGHADGTVTFFEGTGDGGFLFRPEATESGLGGVEDLAAGDFDADGDLDLAVTGGDRATLLLNDNHLLTSSPIVNGAFEAGLTGWQTEIVGHAQGTTAGTVNALGGFAQLTENESFLISVNQTFLVPPDPLTLSLDVVALGLEDPAGGVPDAFEVSLLDPISGASVVPTFRPEATSFFNVNWNGMH